MELEDLGARTCSGHPAGTEMCQPSSCPQGAPGLQVKGRLSGTQAAWLQEERNRHPKDSKDFQMGKFMSGWGARETS